MLPRYYKIKEELLPFRLFRASHVDIFRIRNTVFPLDMAWGCLDMARTWFNLELCSFNVAWRSLMKGNRT